MTFELNAAARLIKAADENVDDHGYLQIGVSYPGHEKQNGYVLNTNGKDVRLNSRSSATSLTTLMFLRNDLNGDQRKADAFQTMVTEAYRKSGGDFDKVVDALVKVTKLPRSAFSRNTYF